MEAERCWKGQRFGFFWAANARWRTFRSSGRLWRQFYDFSQKIHWIRALADMDLKPPRLQDGIQIRANERKVVGRKPPRHLPALSTGQDDLAYALQLQERRRDAGNHIVYEQEQRRFAVDPAVVVDRYRDFDEFARP